LDGVTARRLAAIAFADIVGYSILMSDDEVGTHQRWMVLLANIVRPGAERHRGRIVKSTGDGVLAEFPTALDAMRRARGTGSGPPRRNRTSQTNSLADIRARRRGDGDVG